MENSYQETIIRFKKYKELADDISKLEKALDKACELLASVEKDGCYYCPLSRSGESLDEIKKKCIAKGGVICMKEDWKEWAFRDE